MKPLHKIAGIKSDRQEYKVIQVKKGFVRATDGFGLIKMPLRLVFPDGLIQEDEELYFDAAQWQAQKMHCAVRFEREGNFFKIFDAKKQIGLIEAKTSIDCRFPDVDVVFPNDRPVKEVEYSNINVDTFYNLCSAFGEKLELFNLTFYGYGKAVVIKPKIKDYEGIGLIMSIEN